MAVFGLFFFFGFLLVIRACFGIFSSAGIVGIGRASASAVGASRISAVGDGSSMTIFDDSHGLARSTSISFDEAISRNLQVMDATAFALCRDQKLPINVFSIFKAGALKRVVMGENEGTLVHV